MLCYNASMSIVPRPNIIWRGAHPNNFTVGRPGGGRDGRNTFHHVVGSAESAVIVFNNPNRGASSHFVITAQPDVIFQCVDLNNTAWCDGNWDSNLRTISMEHDGTWLNGYDNPTVRENSAKLVAWMMDQGLVGYPVRHRDVSQLGTACPGDLPVEAIWNRAKEIVAAYNQPVDNRPEWMKNRSEVPGKMVYAQSAGIFVHNLNDPDQPLDSRRFALNQNFEIKGQTIAGGKEFWITRSSFDANIASGLLKSDVADAPFVPPTPQIIVEAPKPTTPDWADSLLVDQANQEMYVLRATPIIDLENGRPFVKDGKEVWLQAGDIVKDVSAHTIVAGVTYYVTEYSFAQIKGQHYQNANGIKASDLSTDPESCPEGTPANPTVTTPQDNPAAMPDVPSDKTPSIDDLQDGDMTSTWIPKPSTQPSAEQPKTRTNWFVILLVGLIKIASKLKLKK